MKWRLLKPESKIKNARNRVQIDFYTRNPNGVYMHFGSPERRLPLYRWQWVQLHYGVSFEIWKFGRESWKVYCKLGPNYKSKWSFF